MSNSEIPGTVGHMVSAIRNVEALDYFCSEAHPRNPDKLYKIMYEQDFGVGDEPDVVQQHALYKDKYVARWLHKYSLSPIIFDATQVIEWLCTADDQSHRFVIIINETKALAPLVRPRDIIEVKRHYMAGLYCYLFRTRVTYEYLSLRYLAFPPSQADALTSFLNDIRVEFETDSDFDNDDFERQYEREWENPIRMEDVEVRMKRNDIRNIIDVVEKSDDDPDALAVFRNVCKKYVKNAATKSSRQLRKELRRATTMNFKKIQPQNLIDPFTQEEIKTILLPFLFVYKDDKNLSWAFDIFSLFDLKADERDLMNPFTRELFPQSVQDEIQSQLEYLEAARDV